MGELENLSDNRQKFDNAVCRQRIGFWSTYLLPFDTAQKTNRLYNMIYNIDRVCRFGLRFKYTFMQ